MPSVFLNVSPVAIDTRSASPMYNMKIIMIIANYSLLLAYCQHSLSLHPMHMNPPPHAAGIDN